jgi:hypothetical protein
VSAAATRADLESFAALLDDLAARAAELEERVRVQRGEASAEGASTVRTNAAQLAREARSGDLASGGAGALPLSRPFGEFDYGPDGDEVSRRIKAVDVFWRERLGRGAFEVVDG